MPVELTAKQLNSIHSRIHTLIKEAAVHDESIESLGPEQENSGHLQCISYIKSTVYREYAGALGYHQVDPEDDIKNIFPMEPRKAQPESVEKLVSVLSKNPYTEMREVTEEFPTITDTKSIYFSIKEMEKLWENVSAQVIAELPELVKTTSALQSWRR